ncbi:DUF3159 domain-containing protein [Compostimonas suwonensis]|uniref:Uncharacterized protein DUF3159 n=1 Tax=Compostimonas suwonensis TaxID=1048394 RepID=A0A2M9BBL9_9MICO|nr:DUF3159 domain-containing protein [Compostimonas suwonensis]PJJ55340.1 uncharacterized protein DUF3159 [Compostimonas suwonensis]
MSQHEPAPDADDAQAAPDASAAPGAPVTPDAPATATFAQSMAEAARRAGFAEAVDGKATDGRTLLRAIGGVRGILEAVLPGLLFVVIYTITQNLVLSIVAPVVIGVVFSVVRVVQKQPLTQALGGLAGIAISAVLALWSGRAEDYYLSGFWTNAAYGAGLLISVLVGWPLIGVAVGFLMGDGVEWKKVPAKRRVFQIVTLCWVGLFAARLAVQLPLYYAQNIEWLGATRLIMGLPLYAPLLIVSWLLIRAVYAKPVAESQGTTA